MYSCKTCGREFDKSAALGGHRANAHPRPGTAQAQAQAKLELPASVKIENMFGPHDYGMLDPIRHSPAYFALPVFVFPISLTGLVMLPITLAVPIIVLTPVLALAFAWYFAARSMVSPVLVLRSLEDRSLWQLEYWSKTDIKTLPPEALFSDGSKFLGVIDDSGDVAIAFDPFSARRAVVSSEALGMAFDQSDAIAIGASLQRMSRREVLQMGAFTLIALGAIGGNVLLYSMRGG